MKCSWVFKGKSRIDEDTWSHFYECSKCGIEIDVENPRHARKLHDLEHCEEIQKMNLVREVMTS